MTSKLVVRLFGRFSVRLGDRELLGRTPGKAKELLAYLAVNRGKPHSRETLAHLLWSESPPQRSKKYLRQILWKLHSDLSVRGAPATSAFLRTDFRWVELVPHERVWLDIAEFEDLCATPSGRNGKGAARRGPPAPVEATQLYGGELLEGWYQEWCLRERERFRQVYLALLDRIVAGYESRRELDAAMGYASLALRTDPSRECTHRALMRMFYRSGNRAAARHQYERCVAALKEELGAPPEDQTRSLMEGILSGRPLDRAASASARRRNRSR